MKVTHINTNSTGGAAKACLRLNDGLIQENIDSRVLTLNNPSKVKNVVEYKSSYAEHFCNFFIKSSNKLKLFSYRNKENSFSFANTGFRIKNHKLIRESDILHLHWVAFFLDYPSFFRNNDKKIVWTLHDMAPFSSGNHYTEPPQVSKVNQDRIIQEKIKSLSQKETSLTIVAPSRWLLEKSKRSLLFSKFPHVHIPNGLDSSIYLMHPIEQVRKELGISIKAKVILFVAESTLDQRKGFQFLIDSLSNINSPQEIILCAVGKIDQSMTDQLKSFISFGYISDESQLAKIYSSADLFIIPSIEDNLPNTMIEALMCGTPVIGFNVGGIGETVINEVNGMISKKIDSNSLADTIQKALDHEFDRDKIRKMAIDSFDIKKITLLHLDLYKSLMG